VAISGIGRMSTERTGPVPLKIGLEHEGNARIENDENGFERRTGAA